VTERLAEDRRRLDAYSKSKKPAPDSAKEDIARGEAETKALAQEIKRRLDEIAATRDKYDGWKKRYLELKQDRSLVPPPATAAAPAAKK
jgi:hypothetical protein